MELLELDDPGLDRLVAGCDTLVHLAWDTRHGLFWRAPENLDWLAASARLLHAFARTGGKRFVGAGTCVEYRAPAEGPCIPGVTPVAPTTLYAVAKNRFHELLARHADDAGMEHAWGRVFHLIGPEEPSARLVPSLIDGLRAGNQVACSSGRQIRDFMDVRDCGEAFARLAVSDAAGAFNVCSGQPVSIAEVAMTIGRMLGREHLVALGARPDNPDEPPNLWGDDELLRRATGFIPRYDWQAAVRHAIDRRQDQTAPR